MTGRLHVIGAGLAGLSAALALTDANRTVTIHEAGPVAGGRCRSYFDRELGLTIDNGNHLLLSGNRAAFAYLDRDRRARHAGRPGDAAVPVPGPARPGALDAAAQRAAGSPGGSCRRPPRARDAPRRLSGAARLARHRPTTHRRRRAAPRRALSRGCWSRWRSPRSTRRREPGSRVCSARWCGRR